jgi:nucleoside 2-deoxyribosyltransferase
MKVYLAIPYTFNPELSFDIANKVSADLMKKGHIVFSPISHSHVISDYLPQIVRTDSDWWMTQDLPFVEWADELHIVVIGERGTELVENVARSSG